MLPRRDTLALEQVVPDGAVGVGVTPGVSWAWSSWTQVSSGLSFPFLLTHVTMEVGYSGSGLVSANEQMQLQVGKGASGSEVDIGEISAGLFMSLTGTSPNAILGYVANFPVTPTIIPASTRIALRATEQLSVQRFQPYCYLYGYNATKYSLPLYLRDIKAIEQLLKGLRTKVARVYPSAGMTVLNAPSASWTWGSWTQIIASTSLSMLIIGIVDTPQTTPQYGQIEIGIGASGSEQAMSKVGIVGYNSGGSGVYYLPRPLLVYKGERVSARFEGTGQAYPPYVNLLYYELS
jgi:hypothetical protein